MKTIQDHITLSVLIEINPEMKVEITSKQKKIIHIK